jgi:hypothetical protein
VGRFQEEMEEMLKRKVMPGKKGDRRKKKMVSDAIFLSPWVDVLIRC